MVPYSPKQPQKRVSPLPVRPALPGKPLHPPKHSHLFRRKPTKDASRSRRPRTLTPQRHKHHWARLFLEAKHPLPEETYLVPGSRIMPAMPQKHPKEPANEPCETLRIRVMPPGVRRVESCQELPVRGKAHPMGGVRRQRNNPVQVVRTEGMRGAGVEQRERSVERSMTEIFEESSIRGSEVNYMQVEFVWEGSRGDEQR